MVVQVKNYPLQIAIDGPVGAGKSTVAIALAQKLKCLYIDTGAMYRAVALGVAARALNLKPHSFKTWLEDYLYSPESTTATTIIQVWSDEDLVSELVSEFLIELERPQDNQPNQQSVCVFLDGVDISLLIRNNLIAEGASIVSQYPVVREVLVAKQQLMAANAAIVMEGRDIGSRVLPDADLKVYLDATIPERVSRKHTQMRSLGHTSSLASTKLALMQRDNREMRRPIDPLKPTLDALIIDSTQLTIQEVVDTICQALESRKAV
jgi:cytidylate kinase